MNWCLYSVLENTFTIFTAANKKKQNTTVEAITVLEGHTQLYHLYLIIIHLIKHSFLPRVGHYDVF